MLRKTSAFIVLACLAIPCASGQGPGAKPPLVVHEWGTFTSMQGSDGLGLEGLHHEEERLPPFVYSRTEVRECPLRQYGYKGLEVPVTHATQKMETPVIYFYTDVPRRARVRVDFVKGLISQWFPVSDLVGPPEAKKEDGPLDLAKVERSFLQWDVDLVPRSAARPVEIPSVADGDPWKLAREVDAAWVRTLPRKRPERMGPTEAEHYLFYRGLGTFEVGMKATPKRDGGGAIEVRSKDAVDGVYVLEVRDGKARYQRLGRIPAGESRPYAGGLEWEPLEPATAEIRHALKADLVAAGLFEKEAAAMVATWTRSWFQTPGLRCFYLVPRAWTDALLPLSIDPAPDALVRVLVGRLEIITPEAEEAVVGDLRRLASKDDFEIKLAMTRLLELDRFLEPHLRRALAISTDEVVRSEAQKLLETLR